MASKLPAEWKALEDAVGGRENLTKICDVNASTIWRWANGEGRPSKLVQAAVNRICEEHGVSPVFGEEADRAST